MTFLFLLPTILAILTLGGHFLRYGLYPATIIFVGFLPLLLIKERWVARTMQVVLVIAAIEWIGVLNDVTKEREMEGRSPVKSVFILGGTSAFTLLAAALYQTPRLKRRYASNSSTKATPEQP